MSSVSDSKIAYIREKFESFLSGQMSKDVGDILSEIEENGWEAYLFGGAPRKALTDSGESPRDYDIVFSDSDFVHFSRYARARNGKENRFGGYKIVISGVEIDAWPLSGTWAFREKYVTEISFKSLQKTVPFNVDSFLIEIFPRSKRHKRRVYCSGYLMAENRRQLDPVLKENPFPSLCLVRAVHLAHSMNLKWSKSLLSWMADISKNTSAHALEEVQISHYGHVIYHADYWVNLSERIQEMMEAEGSNFTFSIPQHPDRGASP